MLIALIVASLFRSNPHLAAQAPPTFEQALKAKGIQTSLMSLRNALRDPRPEVRGLAASMLAEKKDTDSIPLIVHALSKASSPLEKENLAQALLTLGDAPGHSAIREVCEDEKAGEDLRLIAAGQLAETGDKSCVKPVVEVLLHTTDHSMRQGAMEFLKRDEEVPSSLMHDLQAGLERALRDEIPSNRQLASECILLFKISSAGDSLRKAIAVEKDPATRLRMKTDLRKLESSSPQ